MNLCDYGCGQEAIYTFKNGKNCCSKNHSLCTTIKSKNNKGGWNNPSLIKKECKFCKNGIGLNSHKKHENTCYLNPTNIRKCPICDNYIENKNTIACSRKCAALYSNLLKTRKHTDETRRKISISLSGDGNIRNCISCNKPTSNLKFCSMKCMIPKEYEKKTYWRRKIIIWEEQGYKCNKCDFNLYTIDNGPYQLHHIDGNSHNKKRENEEILCCNCHAMTDNYSFKGRKHSLESKKLISINNGNRQ